MPLISFEGIEGIGKSTQVARIGRRLSVYGSVLTTYEPGDTEVGQKLREILLRGDLSPLPQTELLLYIAERAEHVRRVLRPALADGLWVLCDRYADATLAYQGYGRGFDLKVVRQLNGFATAELIPDLTVLLDAPVSVGLARAKGRALLDRIEAEAVAFHEKVRAGYLSIAAEESARFVVVDAEGELDAVEDAIFAAVARRFSLDPARSPRTAS